MWIAIAGLGALFFGIVVGFLWGHKTAEQSYMIELSRQFPKSNETSTCQ